MSRSAETRQEVSVECSHCGCAFEAPSHDLLTQRRATILCTLCQSAIALESTPISCPYCVTKLIAANILLGTKVSCPVCHSTLELPEQVPRNDGSGAIHEWRVKSEVSHSVTLFRSRNEVALAILGGEVHPKDRCSPKAYAPPIQVSRATKHHFALRRLYDPVGAWTERCATSASVFFVVSLLALWCARGLVNEGLAFLIQPVLAVALVIAVSVNWRLMFPLVALGLAFREFGLIEFSAVRLLLRSAGTIAGIALTFGVSYLLGKGVGWLSARVFLLDRATAVRPEDWKPDAFEVPALELAREVQIGARPLFWALIAASLWCVGTALHQTYLSSMYFEPGFIGEPISNYTRVLMLASGTTSFLGLILAILWYRYRWLRNSIIRYGGMEPAQGVRVESLGHAIRQRLHEALAKVSLRSSELPVLLNKKTGDSYVLSSHRETWLVISLAHVIQGAHKFRAVVMHECAHAIAGDHRIVGWVRAVVQGTLLSFGLFFVPGSLFAIHMAPTTPDAPSDFVLQEITRLLYFPLMLLGLLMTYRIVLRQMELAADTFVAAHDQDSAFALDTIGRSYRQKGAIRSFVAGHPSAEDRRRYLQIPLLHRMPNFLIHAVCGYIVATVGKLGNSAFSAAFMEGTNFYIVTATHTWGFIWLFVSLVVITIDLQRPLRLLHMNHVSLVSRSLLAFFGGGIVGAFPLIIRSAIYFKADPLEISTTWAIVGAAHFRATMVLGILLLASMALVRAGREWTATARGGSVLGVGSAMAVIGIFYLVNATWLPVVGQTDELALIRMWAALLTVLSCSWLLSGALRLLRSTGDGHLHLRTQFAWSQFGGMREWFVLLVAAGMAGGLFVASVPLFIILFNSDPSVVKANYEHAMSIWIPVGMMVGASSGLFRVLVVKGLLGTWARTVVYAVAFGTLLLVYPSAAFYVLVVAGINQGLEASDRIRRESALRRWILLQLLVVLGVTALLCAIVTPGIAWVLSIGGAKVGAIGGGSGWIPALWRDMGPILREAIRMSWDVLHHTFFIATIMTAMDAACGRLGFPNLIAQDHTT